MCGIAGFVPYESQRSNVNVISNTITSLLIHNTARGTDSAGIAAVTDTGRTRIIKRAQDPRTFLLQRDVQNAIHSWAKKGDVVAWMLHTRAATTGAVTDINAHPFRCGSVTVVHNGWIYNHDTVAKQYGLSLISQCDSEVIAAIMNLDPTYTKLASLCGEFAIIAFDARHTGHLYLARATNPLWIRKGTPWGTLFSSQPIDSESIVTRKKRMLADRNAWTSLTQESAYLFDIRKHKLIQGEAPKWESTFLRSRDWRSQHGYYGSYGSYYGRQYYDANDDSVYEYDPHQTRYVRKSASESAKTFVSDDETRKQKLAELASYGEGLWEEIPDPRTFTKKCFDDEVVGIAFDRGLIDSVEWSDLDVSARSRLYNWWKYLRDLYGVR